jgi:hypothetical protein
MKIAYLVFAYKNPRLIKREIEALSSESSAFFVHIDKKSDLSDFSSVRGENVFYVDERIPVYWGEFSGVRAILLLMRNALERAEKFDYLVLLSGSEYPIRSRQYIEKFLIEHKGDEFMKLAKVPAPGKPLSRFTTRRYESTKPARRFVSRVLAKFGFAQRDPRKWLRNLELYSGRTWWALSGGACDFILRFAEENPQVEEFFTDSFAPEESFFHTIIGNSGFCPRVRGNLVYEDWSEGGSHPKLIAEEHIAQFESRDRMFDLSEGPSELLFARKFSDDNIERVDRVDLMIARKEQRAPSVYADA